MNPKLHLHPEQNWMNDPNGFIYYNRLYHLFYQYFPYGTEWGSPHWIHTTSKDLLHFDTHGLAVFPSKLYDSDGCYSGTAIEKDGKLQLYYTSVHYTEPDPENIHVSFDNEASTAMIVSEDGFTFDNLKDKKMIIPAGGRMHHKQTRDPKVWKHGDTWYMVMASQYVDEDGNNQGQLAFHTSEDSENWEFRKFYRGFRFGTMWECPDLFEAEGQWMLILSPENTEDHGYPSQAWIAPVRFEHETLDLELERDLQLLDYGRDLYAPQTTLSEDGKRIYIGWLRMPKAVDGWRGVMTFPREIHYKDGILYTPMLQSAADRFCVEGEFDPKEPCCITCSLSEGDYINVGGYELKVEHHHLKADRSDVLEDPAQIVDMQVETPELAQACLEIYVDDGVVETYVNAGQYVITQVVDGLSDLIASNVDYCVMKTSE